MPIHPLRALLPTLFFLSVVASDSVSSAQADRGAAKESTFLSNVRRITFDGRRAGEGYFSADGSMMIFQSEREPGNPFYQIYVMDLETGDITRVSPGHGKTTCAWIHPNGRRALYASTHDDPEARAKQKAELDIRASGKERRYEWDYDEHFDIYVSDLDGKNIRNVTNARGYDAEGSFSPDGKLIAFTSNRHAYGPNADSMTEAEAKRFAMDKSLMLDLYIMNADGSNVKRLMNVKGYDGGPFFSPNGKRICWRRFNEKGDKAEIYTMNIDGSDVKRLTHLNAMSWAPFYHPSGEYLIFTTNKHGFSNFELYLVSVDGGTPVRVSTTDGFDGLPVFTPDGKRIAWTSTRHGEGRKAGQIYFADWHHDRALAALRDAAAKRVQEKAANAGGVSRNPRADAPVAAVDVGSLSPKISVDDLRRHVETLAATDLGGRHAGTKGEARAADYVASVFEALGLAPAGDDGTWFQTVETSVGVRPAADGNDLTLTRTVAGRPNRIAIGAPKAASWRPLAASSDAESAVEGSLVFVGYGLGAPSYATWPAYDSFGGVDIADKWAVVLDGVPGGIDAAWARHLAGFASLPHKVRDLADRGAIGVIVIGGAGRTVGFGAPTADEGIPVIAVDGPVLAHFADAVPGGLDALVKELDRGEPTAPVALPDRSVSVTVKLARETVRGRNVVARLDAGDAPIAAQVMIGAHVDGPVPVGASTQVSTGANDNASGVAAMLEIAQWLQSRKRAGRLALKRDVIFAALTGGSIGLVGAKHYVNTADALGDEGAINPPLNAYLNLDAIASGRGRVTLGGLGSSATWRKEIEKRNVPVGLSIDAQEPSFLPSDATPFYLTGVPVLSASTRANDTAVDDLTVVDFAGAAKVARLVGLIARGVAVADDAPAFNRVSRTQARRPMRGNVALGTMPDYSAEDVDGMKLQGVRAGSPAEKAGVKGGDVVVELGGVAVDDIYGYMEALNKLEADKKTTIIVVRDGKRVTLQIVPERKG